MTVYYCLGLLAVSLVAFSGVLNCGFIESYDDEMYITLNPVVSQGVTWEGVAWSFSTFVSGNWHPLTWWSHMLDVSLFGLRPAGHHAVNLCLHLANTILLFGVLARSTGRRGTSCFVAALFALHPLHVESVAWVAERKDVLSTLFGLAAIHAYLTYSASHARRYFYYSLILLCCSLMSKPMLVTFPLLLAVLDYWPLERDRCLPWRSLITEKLPLFVPVAAISLLAVAAQESAGALVSLAEASPGSRILTALNAYAVYVGKTFIPVNLASFYPYSPVPWYQGCLAAGLLAAASLVIWRLRQNRRWLIAGWLWFLVALLPVIGLVRIGEQAYADRYTYLALTGLGIIVAWGGDELLMARPWLKMALAAICVLLCGALTGMQVRFWENSESLYSREIAVSGQSWHGHFGLANELAKRHEFDRAIEHYAAVLVTKPNSLDTLNNLGSSLRGAGRYREALPYFLKAVQAGPDYTLSYYNLALTLTDMGNRVGAEDALRQVLAIDPQFLQAQQLLDFLHNGNARGQQ